MIKIKATEQAWFKITQLALCVGSLGILLHPNFHSLVRAQNTSVPPISNESSETAADLYEQGKTAVAQENYRDAIANFSQAIQLNPNRAEYYYERGLVLGKLGDKEGAIRDFDSAILRNPNYAQAYLQRAGMSFYVGSPRRITDSRGIDFRSVDYRARNSQAMLDLRTARDLFARQGDREGLKTANQLIKHFVGKME